MSTRRITHIVTEVDFDPNLARKDRVTHLVAEVEASPSASRKDRVSYLILEVECAFEQGGPPPPDQYGPVVQCM